MIQSETLELLEWSRLCQHLATFAATKLGAFAARYLHPPATQPESLDLLAQTKEAYQLETSLDTGLTFDGIQDIGESLDRAELQGILSGEELLAIATTLAGVRRLRRFIEDQEDVPILKELVADSRTYPELEQEIHRCIDDRGDVADRATPKLAGIRTQIKSLRDRIYEILQGIVQRKGGALQQQLITQRADRFVLPVKAPQKDSIPGIVHDTSSTGATLYVEPKSIVGLGNQLRTQRRQEQVEAEAVRRALSQQVAAVKPDLERLLVVATTLDLATAKARYSLWLEANPPRFIDRNQNESITLRQLRHPLLVWQQKHEQGTSVVPIDVQIQSYIRVVAITGPNTGGKTVTLKTFGLAALMAKAGLFVPAREPVELPWFEQILADIGDEQSIEQSLSTFSGHIRRISRIIEAITTPKEELQVDRLKVGGSQEFQVGRLKVLREQPDNLGQKATLREQPDNLGQKATLREQPDNLGQKATLREQPDNIQPANLGQKATLREQPDNIQPANLEEPSTPRASLVLLDEVGAGTDPAEGSALAIALLKYLANTTQLTIATTHYGELKALKYQDERFENASVEFDDQTLSPTYRLLWGIPGRSNALSIARRLGLNPSVVDQAQTLLGGASEDVNEVIAGLEAQRRTQETKAQQANQLLQQAESLHQELSERAKLLQERERELKLSQERSVQDAIAQAKKEIAQVIRQLQQGSQTAQNAQKATNALKEIAQRQIPAAPPPKPKPGFRPKVGDRIRIPRLNQTAEIISAADNGELTVRFGLMKMTIALADVESLDGQKPENVVKTTSKPAPAPTPVSPPATAVRTSKNTIDIRGSRVANAEIDIDQAISKAIEFGVLWIIHGKGTGRLRQGVHAFLEQHPLVERFKLAEQSEGGTGVTVAYLK
ncbi:MULTISPECIES: endonuclease MutS2 [unclassified Moorena]|uniref:endonuclease MutS2 n=1 Tax=unclassified Moorena TaxID=2683338 RepID=UPI0013FF6667|nr:MULTISPECIES: endonuclease MutS2 [unclassified Moorena]NEO17021.1 endonuclease MutS2 [Moorena sp. SIO3E8]NEQ01998.1 endonuclease MutS2 [Moorena sp. SIO3F7]